MVSLMLCCHLYCCMCQKWMYSATQKNHLVNAIACWQDLKQFHFDFNFFHHPIFFYYYYSPLLYVQCANHACIINFQTCVIHFPLIWLSWIVCSYIISAIFIRKIYMSNSKQTFSTDALTSTSCFSGVPQGSFVGPLIVHPKRHSRANADSSFCSLNACLMHHIMSLCLCLHIIFVYFYIISNTNFHIWIH